MKYIRTKEGKDGWLMTEEKRKELIYCAVNEYGCSNYDIPIEKQADTIEELCDYELHYNSENELVIRKCKDVNFNILKSNLKDGYIKDVKLAILTNKGLIFVAKMNEKGELELL